MFVCVSLMGDRLRKKKPTRGEQIDPIAASHSFILLRTSPPLVTMFLLVVIEMPFFT